MADQFTFQPDAHRALRIDEASAVRVGPGCTRRDLPSNPGVRVWIVEMEPGSEWPQVDRHDNGEEYYVISGEVIEGERHYPTGTYVTFAPGSQHRPRTETGVRLFGINLAA
jgi:anti-sigma factor ChrR (cupin superfamily)